MGNIQTYPVIEFAGLHSELSEVFCVKFSSGKRITMHLTADKKQILNALRYLMKAALLQPIDYEKMPVREMLDMLIADQAPIVDRIARLENENV